MAIKQNCIDYLKSTDNKCCGCGSCSNACPVKAISMTHDPKGFLVPTINKEKCIDCGICKTVCPIFIHVEKKTNTNQTKPQIIAFTGEKEILSKSSSGGGILIYCQLGIK